MRLSVCLIYVYNLSCLITNTEYGIQGVGPIIAATASNLHVDSGIPDANKLVSHVSA